ncbi:MAG: hypothetical protein JWN17_2247 [Frankiales bacterium]|nr:hypothetical protein [Frankiales bacterium]
MDAVTLGSIPQPVAVAAAPPRPAALPAPQPRRAPDEGPSAEDAAPPLPLAVQREHLQPPAAPMLSREQMNALLARMIVGGAAPPPAD